MALLMTASVMATSPAFLANPMMVFAEEGTESPIKTYEDENGEYQVNEGQLDTNSTDLRANAPEGSIGTNTGKVEQNDGTITTNSGAIGTNCGTVTNNTGTGSIANFNSSESKDLETVEGNGIIVNQGTVENNSGDIIINDGKVDNNTGTIAENVDTVNQNTGTINVNNATVNTNAEGGTITENNGSVDKNNGTVKTNHANITTNNGTVEDNSCYIAENKKDKIVKVNNDCIFNNYGIVEDNKAWVGENRENATVTITFVPEADKNGSVGRNQGQVNICIDKESVEAIDDAELEKIAKESVLANCNVVDIIGTNNSTVRFFGISAYNGELNEKYFKTSLDSVKDGGTYTLSIPSQYGVDGNVLLADISNVILADGESANFEKEGEYYIIPIGTQFKVNGVIEFRGKWYKIVPTSDGGAVIEEVTDITPVKVVEIPKMSSNSIPGVEIKDWNDVSDVLATKADAITAEPNSNTKLLKLELSKDKLAVPASVVSGLFSSKVDGLHCFIGDSDAITFVNNGTLDKYIPTDFTHTDQVTDSMKVIDFAKPQAIGATVLLSTRVPAKNKPVAIWMLVDGKYELVGHSVANENGNVAFPISSIGKFILTY